LFLDLRILKELRRRFADLRILKGLDAFFVSIAVSRRPPQKSAASEGGLYTGEDSTCKLANRLK